MIKKNLLTASILAFSSLAHSEEVTLTLDIAGQGVVSIEGSELSCTETCELMVEENTPLTLQHFAETNFAFSQWGKQSCDSGQGVIITDELSNLSSSTAPPKTMAMADFNGDGIDDIAMLTLFSSTLKTKFNEGAGQFSDLVKVDSLSYASAMDTIDWDQDNDQDIVVVDYGDSTVKLYLNDGNGNFTFEANLSIPGVRPYAIAIADIDADNQPDILVASFSGNIGASNLQGLIDSITNTDLSWYKNEGEHQFSHLETVSTDQGIFTLDIADVDNDGDLDIAAAATTSNQILLYTNNQGSYQQSTIATGKAAYAVAFKDIDKNGLPDIASTFYYDHSLKLAMQQSGGGFSQSEKLTRFNAGPTTIAISDVDNDGRLDIASGVFGDNAFYWQRNLSYQSCVITPTAARTVGAIFLETSTTTPSTDNSSGGGMGVFTTLCLVVALFRRKLFNLKPV